jgi:hypothetical protein
MKPYEAWKAMVETERQQEEHDVFWSAYFDKETEAYRTILTENTGKLTGTLAELSDRFGMSVEESAGFMDGINTSLAKEVNLDKLNADTALKLEIDFEKLYFNMHKARANWLYTLKEWETVLSEEKRRDIAKAYRQSNIFVRETHTGRNDPCPCGSGKKYKACCGKNA